MQIIRQFLANVKNRIVYDLLSKFDENKSEITLMNYGYKGKVDLPMPKVSKNEKNRLRLYMHVVGGVDIWGKDVVEIASGRGKGAHFIAKEMKPKSMEATDISPKAIKFSQSYFRAPGLRYSVGDAQNLHFKNRRFDVAINIESSHWYGSTSAFFKEVHRVLKAGGLFLFADFRNKPEWPLVEKELKSAGFKINFSEDITSNVIAALEEDHQYKKLIVEKVPKPIRGLVATFAAIYGSSMYNDFVSGRKVYKNYILSSG